ncbi:hypothetical protein D3C74_131590 [compost metagenome]
MNDEKPVVTGQESKSKTVKKATYVEQQSTHVYLGPTLKTYPLRQNATYSNGIPFQFQQLVATNADVAFLFVTLDKTVEYRRELKDPTSEQSVIFKLIQQSEV